jgi:nucleotide-binding universal stress UspA family protein
VAFRVALAWARAEGADLRLVHVWSHALGYVRDAALRARLRASFHDRARRRLDRLAAEARRAGGRVDTAVLEGAAAHEIVRAATSMKADLIVLGTHGRTGVARLLLGSVAARVVATAPCPVLTVRRAP